MITEDMNRIEQAKTDDRVFCELYDLYFPKIYAYVLRRVGNRDTAEDIVSATFEKVFLHLDRFKPAHGSFQAWVYRIATNQIIDHVRKMKRITILAPEDMPETAAERYDSITLIAAKEESEHVREALKAMPAKYQRVLLLKFFSDLSNQEIAETLGVTLGHAGVLLHRALKRFQAIFADYDTP